ncbi:MAG: S8 family serine peptidase [Chitinispirillales bacterium]|jgi:subtilisin family serine protease|nr:S8 family serine peptidase [Chitinispirillales bacterium]
MKRNLSIYLLIALLLIALPHSVAADTGLSESLQAVADKDTICNVWVFFKDRPTRSDAARVSPQAALRRGRAGFRAGDSDRPVDRQHIGRVERHGAVLRREFPWGNAASFSVHSSRLAEIASLPFVKSVSPVAVFIREVPNGAGIGGLGRMADAYDGYGWHLNLVNIPAAHEYMRAKGLPAPGTGVRMAFFDAGFRLEHRAYSRLRDSSSVIADSCFVGDGMTIYNLDSAARDTAHPSHIYYRGDRHGTQTLGLVAAYHPGTYMGAAWGARFMLARTEDMVIEARVEEDNWAAAVIWAEELGVDIISSSLGYRYRFDDPDEDYTYQQMDGQTAVISIAAKGAVERGVIVVNSVGNDGTDNLGNLVSGSLTAPADVDGVVAVGAVDHSLSIASFSSSGPTFDGRFKPDLVAPGVSVPLLDPYPLSTGSYTGASGTSFAAPIVSGILAMILQVNPGISPEEARNRLYNSCSFVRGQTSRDNRRGHGMPDALRAIMADNELFFRITDNTGKALVGAKILVGDSVHIVDESGYLLAEAPPSELPAKFVITFRDKEVGAFIVGALPFTDEISVDIGRDSGLRLFPTIVRKNSPVRGVYMFAGLDRSIPATVSVHALNGRIVHGPEELRIGLDGTAVFTWNHRAGRRKIAAGMYLLTVRHGYDLISGRIVVAD